MAVREFNFIVGPETSELPAIGVPSSPDDLISQGYADERYTQGSEAVSNNAALKAIAEAERRDGDFVLVKDTNRVYRFDSGSADSDDANFVLAPDSGTGRWIRVTILNKANTFTDTTDSTSKDTGSMILEGGLGVEKSVFIGGNIEVTGNMTVLGTTTTIDVDTMEVEDPNITVNRGGNQSTANTNKSGFTVSMSDATDARIGYETAAVSKFVAGEVGSESEILTKASTQDISGKKTFDSASGTDFLEIAEPTTPASSDGRLYFSSADKTFHQKDDNGVDQSLVTESEFVNYITNPSASASKNDWTDSGTSTVSTRTTTSAELPRGFERLGALKIAVGSSGTDYTYARFTLGNSDAGKHIAISWLQLAGSTFADGDLKFEVYTNAQSDYLGAYTEVPLDTDVSGDTDLKASELSFYSSFRDPDTNPYYEVRFVRKANGGGANDFVTFNEITVKPANINHAIRPARDVVTASKTVAAYTVYLVDTSGGAITLTLPPCKDGLLVGFVDISDSWGSNNITLTPDGSDTVDYDTLDVSGVWVRLIGNGTNWEIKDPIVPNSANFSGSVTIDGTIKSEGTITTDSQGQDLTVDAGTSLTHPYLTIETGDTYTIDGQLFVPGNLVVEGTLIDNGTVLNIG